MGVSCATHIRWNAYYTPGGSSYMVLETFHSSVISCSSTKKTKIYINIFSFLFSFLIRDGDLAARWILLGGSGSVWLPTIGITTGYVDFMGWEPLSFIFSFPTGKLLALPNSFKQSPQSSETKRWSYISHSVHQYQLYRILFRNKRRLLKIDRLEKEFIPYKSVLLRHH